jgi:hypothetical protein
MALNSKQQMFWTNEKRKLSDLKPWERNPRQIKDKQAKLLAESFSDFGQVETIAISANGDIYNGHQRLSVLAGKYGMDYEVDVRVSSRDLTEKERERLTVYLHRGATGEWDFDELANWDMSDLLTWGFEESDFPFDVAPATDGEWGDALNKLPDEDRAPFQQITFTLHDTQVEIVKSALSIAGKLSNFEDSPNENGNGNSLSFICEAFITEHGNS